MEPARHRAAEPDRARRGRARRGAARVPASTPTWPGSTATPAHGPSCCRAPTTLPEARQIVQGFQDATLEQILTRLTTNRTPRPALRIALKGWLGFMDQAILDWTEHRDLSAPKLRATCCSTPSARRLRPRFRSTRGSSCARSDGRRARPTRSSSMRSFACGHCGHLVFFENTVCLNCSTPLGFVPRRLELVALEGQAAEALHRCANAELAACNWMVDARGRAVPVVRADPDPPQRLRPRGPGRVRQRRRRQASRDHAAAGARAPGASRPASWPSTCSPASASRSPPGTPTG